MYPDKTETQRKGVKIDIEIKPTIEGLKQGRDEILEKAIELGSE
jgi:C-terminal processing protease CtpA/Prc